MEVAMEIEDDLFFQDLSKQISLLIMDDDEDPVARCPSVSLQAFSRVIHPSTQYPILHDQNCRRESKGTGVFIPRSSQPRRKNRQGRFNSSNTKSQRQPDNNTRGVSHLSYKNSFNPKKC
ncbi:hypothetical protein AAG906_024861 [Vitis piasezkii]|uniref:uncharacterized protein LOC117914358 n=1 Tax=Vitis riparia TaxID=96939 RepID=UPI00155AB4CF|nr:uncharacterized protein LOC117914358 [Vitis riparia]